MFDMETTALLRAVLEEVCENIPVSENLRENARRLENPGGGGTGTTLSECVEGGGL